MIIAILISILAIILFLFLQQKTFGINPSGERLLRIEKSSNYVNGSFRNLVSTEIMLKGTSFIKLMFQFFNKPASTAPPKVLPSVKTDLINLKAIEPTIIWFGHSSYLIKTKHYNILVDPVFSGHASPVSFIGKAFEGSNNYSTEDFPDIDILIITHDHYDHLDYDTVTKLIPKVKKIITALGVGAHLEHWGVKSEIITELDWWEMKKISDNVDITATPARHFSGRKFKRGKTLWASFALKIEGYNLFLGGDSGFGNHFKEIGEKFGPFDLAILECGQYGDKWPFIHMLPEQTIEAAKDLKAKILLPVHWGKFILSTHDWNEPIKRVSKAAIENNITITTPMIGEALVLNNNYPVNKWWDF